MHLLLVLRRYSTSMILSIFSLLIIAGCSGGGSAGGAQPSQSSISLSTKTITASASTSAAAPTASLQISVTNPPANAVYVGYTNTSNGIASVQVTAVSPTTSNVSVFFKAPAQLGTGTYTDTLDIAVCYDTSCAQPVSNSPQHVNVSYTVTAGATSAATPVLSTMTPPSVTAGGAAFTLVVNGTGFIAQSQLQWGGVTKPTTYISAKQVSVQLAATDIVLAGTHTVMVTNAVVAGGASNVLNFTVSAPVALSLTSVSPSQVKVGSPAFVMTAQGTGFTTTSTLRWNGGARATQYISPTKVIAQITAGDIAALATANIDIVDTTPVGTSAALPVAVVAVSKDATALQLNAQHTGVINFNSLSLPLGSKWSVNLGGTPSYALTGAGNVFVTVNLAAGGTQLRALDQASGATVWGPISIPGVANASYDGNTVFVLSNVIGSPGLMQAYVAATGALLWSTTLTGQTSFSSPPTAENGMVYAVGAGTGGTVYAVRQANGTIAWTAPVANGDSSAPTVSADGLYVNYPCQTYDFRPSTGESIWQDNTGCAGSGGATPALTNGVLYAPNGFGTYNGSTINAASGLLVSTFVADNMPALGTTSGYFLQSGILRGLTLSNNAVQWSFSGDGKLVTSPLVVNQYVFVGSSAGNVYAVNSTTGLQAWSMNVGAAIPSGAGWGARMPISGLTAGNGLLLVPAGNTLTAYTLSTTP
ncbi:MAG: PQQ-binding-like beta-propeller repeat protein [Gallionella sp.]